MSDIHYEDIKIQNKLCDKDSSHMKELKTNLLQLAGKLQMIEPDVMSQRAHKLNASQISRYLEVRKLKLWLKNIFTLAPPTQIGFPQNKISQCNLVLYLLQFNIF